MRFLQIFGSGHMQVIRVNIVPSSFVRQLREGSILESILQILLENLNFVSTSRNSGTFHFVEDTCQYTFPVSVKVRPFHHDHSSFINLSKPVLERKSYFSKVYHCTVCNGRNVFHHWNKRKESKSVFFSKSLRYEIFHY